MEQLRAPEPANLPGGYYGPPVLPTSTPPRRRRPCSCCLLSTAIRIFVAVCAATVVTLIILWLVFRPHRVRVAASAALTRSNLTTSPYDLAAVFSIRNPNRRIGVHYDWLEARAYLGDQLRRAALPTFYQGHKNTTVLGPVFFAGVSAVGDNRDRWLDVELWLRGRVRYKFGSLATTRRYNLRAKCNLNLPLITRNSTNTASQSTGCHVYRN
ncbi:NDR1/HIN1-like protein 10 [Zingiber officinale]|uniref:NDR1/HIN1-like protein 10 n=1 Tax=Zingiber officinale TaxID=94328 RepID=UPI001C4D32A5|nr:NDR1/HIN1-like protein 10 [Zingiber officinale]